MSTFNVGDEVRIVRRVETEEGWDDEWVDSMNETIGRVGTIEREESGGYLVKDDFAWCYPASALELVK